MKVCVLFSGGKDSTFAVWCAMHQAWDVRWLVNVRPTNPESWMFHYPATRWTELQAKVMGLPLVAVETSGDKDREIEDLREVLENLTDEERIDGLVSGAVESEYQRTRLDNLAEEIGIRSFAPLWRKNAGLILKEELECGFRFIITACNALGLGPEWLGREIDLTAVKELERLSASYGINLAFEGGEAETMVLDGPIFKQAIEVSSANFRWKGDSGYLEIEEARSRPKPSA